MLLGLARRMALEVIMWLLDMRQRLSWRLQAGVPGDSGREVSLHRTHASTLVSIYPWCPYIFGVCC